MRLYNKEIVKIGGSKPYSEVYIQGSWSEGKMLAYYINVDDKVVGIASLG